MILTIVLFKASVVTAFTIGLKFWFEETDKTYVALIYWFAGLFFVFLNTQGALNGLTELITGDYMKFNVFNTIFAFVFYTCMGAKYFSRE